MKAIFLKVLGFVVLVDLIYLGIGQTLLQVEVHPPPKLVITTDTDVETLISMGETLVREKGGCELCHKIAETGGDRAPDLRGIGSRAARRNPPQSAEEYITESLLRPHAFVVEEFKTETGKSPMPVANKPPANFTPSEVKAVVAFLQSLGGEVTVQVTAEDVAEAEELDKKAQSSAGAVGFMGPGQTLMTIKGCTVCHDTTGEEGYEEARQGPPLTSVAFRRTRDEIRASIEYPDAIITPNYEAGVMPSDFTDPNALIYIEPEQLDDIVAYLSGEEKAEGPAFFLHLVLLILLFNGLVLGAITWLSEPEKEKAAPVPVAAPRLTASCPTCEGTLYVFEPLTRCQSCGAVHHSHCWGADHGCAACAARVDQAQAGEPRA